MGSKVFEGVSYYLAEKSMQEPAEVGHRPRHVGLVVPTGTPTSLHIWALYLA